MSRPPRFCMQPRQIHYPETFTQSASHDRQRSRKHVYQLYPHP
jgi:hypothetical protein